MDIQETNVPNVKIFIGDILRSQLLVEIVIVLENTLSLGKEVELDKKDKKLLIMKPINLLKSQ